MREGHQTGQKSPADSLVGQQVIDDQAFRKHSGFDLASFDDRNATANDVMSFKVLKSQSFTAFKKQLLSQYGVAEQDEQQYRLWVLVNRQNKTVRPDAWVPDDPELSTYFSFWRTGLH